MCGGGGGGGGSVALALVLHKVHLRRTPSGVRVGY